MTSRSKSFLQVITIKLSREDAHEGSELVSKRWGRRKSPRSETLQKQTPQMGGISADRMNTEGGNPVFKILASSAGISRGVISATFRFWPLT